MPTSYIDVLKKNNAVLVHCSSFVSLVGSAQTNQLGSIEKICKVITGNYDISCSTIVCGDQPVNNYTGNFGVILAPRTSESITLASHNDTGSTPELRELVRNSGTVASPLELHNAIINRVTYNEIYIHTYRVLGLFFTKPIQFGIDTNVIELEDKELYSCFPAYDFFQCLNGVFQRVVYDKKHEVFSIVKSCNATNIYG